MSAAPLYFFHRTAHQFCGDTLSSQSVVDICMVYDIYVVSQREGHFSYLFAVSTAYILFLSVMYSISNRH